MGNMIDYVCEFGHHTFTEEPLNEIDSLVLCQIVYLTFDRFVPGLDKRSPPVSIADIYEHADRDRIFDDYWYREDNIALFQAVAQSKRFGSLKLNYYVNILNHDNETQFSAMTYVLDNKDSFIAYRGTDTSIVGWTEDLNLAFSKPVHSQFLSVEYMDRVAGYIAGEFYAGGHSKGGNLAVYAAMNCGQEAKNKLLKVYNNDGPGFRPEILNQGKYEEIEERIIKFIPRSSMVGIILESNKNYEVVESKSIGMMQHNSYSWKVDGTSFVRAGNVGMGKMLMDAALNEWILSMSEEEIHSFVDAVRNIVSAAEADNLFDFGAEWKKNMQNILEAVKEMDEDTKKAIQKIFRSLFEITGEIARQDIREKQQERKEKKVKKSLTAQANEKNSKISLQKG